eukprot:SAG22_NODE_7690_length_717_cov_0.744337_1_plen_92_part_00
MSKGAGLGKQASERTDVGVERGVVQLGAKTDRQTASKGTVLEIEFSWTHEGRQCLTHLRGGQRPAGPVRDLLGLVVVYTVVIRWWWWCTRW